MKKLPLLGILFVFLLISLVSATDTQVWQGKYLTGNSSTAYTFNFTVYDSLTGGNICYSNQTTLTTNSDKWWDTYQYNVLSSCSNSLIDYYLNINIDSVDQSPRRLLKQLKYLDGSGNVEINGDLHMTGVITHNSPVILRDGLKLVHSNGTDYLDTFHILISDEETRSEAGYEALTNATDNTLVFFTHNIANLYKMGYMFFDDVSNRSDFVINQGGVNRSSLFDRSLQVGKSFGNASIDENYTLCQGFNLIDCDTSLTGADLGVEDDIEAKGSIYSQENITADYFIGDGSQLTGISGGAGANDTIWNITGSNYLINSSGILEINETKLNETINSLENDTLYYAGEIYIYKNGSNYFFINETKLNETIDSRGNGNTYLNLSGTNANQDINISPYNLQTENITANYGFFGWLGSLANRITKLWVGEINATGNIQTEANVTANYFIGEGSQLTGVNTITQSTGLIQGGVLSTNVGDNTLIDITAGSGQVVDSTTDPDNLVLIPFTWTAKTGYNLATTASAGDVVAIFLSLNSSGDVVERLELPTPEERRNTIDLGIASRNDTNHITFIGSGPLNVIHNPTSQLQDFFQAWGPFNVEGNQIQPNAVDDLQIKKLVGSVFRNGANFQTDGKNPHIVDLAEQAPVSPFNYKLSDGTDVTMTADINPNSYDDGTSTLATVPNNKWTVQYVTVFASGLVEILYGQEVFDTESDAVTALSTIDFTIPTDSKGAVPLSYLVLQQSDTILPEDRFYRISRIGTGGTGGTTYSAGTGIEISNSLISLNTTYTDTLYLAIGYTSLSNFTDDILWTSGFNATGDNRWGGGADTIWNINNSKYLINDSNILDINETKLNITIDNRAADLTNYALKNQSETFAGNITTPDYGFFGWLGSLTSRITNLFIQDIYFNGTISGDNITINSNGGDIATTGNLIAKDGTFSGNVEVADDLNMTSNNITSVDCITFISGGKICNSP